jgi:peptidyl-prolyl cis-trans isomerase C
MRLTVFPASACAVLLCLSGAALAQSPPAQPSPAQAQGAGNAAPPAPASSPAADPVVAKVGPDALHLSDVEAMFRELPPEFRNMPRQALYAMVLDQLVERQALVQAARKQGLDKNPVVASQMANAANNALSSAYVARQLGPSINEEAIRALYDKEYAGKPGEVEVHARHILVGSEKEAEKVIAELKAGGDFAALAKKYSTDPAAAQGGDLGFFKKSEMIPEFAEAAFALKPGQFTEKPVHTQYGWHIIQVLERRQNPPPTYAQTHDELRQQLIQRGIQKLVQEALNGVKVEKFNPDGSPIRATDTAEPPAPPAAAVPTGPAGK